MRETHADQGVHGSDTAVERYPHACQYTPSLATATATATGCRLGDGNDDEEAELIMDTASQHARQQPIAPLQVHAAE